MAIAVSAPRRPPPDDRVAASREVAISWPYRHLGTDVGGDIPGSETLVATAVELAGRPTHWSGIRPRAVSPFGPRRSRRTVPSVLPVDTIHDIVNLGPVPAISVHVYAPRLPSMTYCRVVEVAPEGQVHDSLPFRGGGAVSVTVDDPGRAGPASHPARRSP